MSRYFIKKLQSQEMGSPTINKDGSISFHRGRYMLISKRYVDFFPFLSTTVLNDKTALAIKPWFTDSIIYAQYVYHNSKRIPEEQKVGIASRDEYRIYLNDQLDNHKAFFRPDDIVVFEKEYNEDFGGYYSLNRYTAFDREYEVLANLLGNGTYVTHDEYLPFISNSLPTDYEEIQDSNVLEAIEHQQETALESKDDNLKSIATFADLFNRSSFRSFVMKAYGQRCAITRQRIIYKDLLNLEAAHIKPNAHKGEFLPCNGIALSRDLHFAFDKGFFTINEDYTIEVHENVLETDSFLNEYNHKKIFVPEIDFFKPNLEFLEYHKAHIYGSFRQIRSIDTNYEQQSISYSNVADPQL